MKIIAVLSCLIFIIFAFGYYALTRKRLLSGTKPGFVSIQWVLVIGLLMRIIMAAAIEGFSTDMGLFRFWSQKAAEDLFHIYQGDFYLDYPPFYLYILFIIGKIAGTLGLTGNEVLYNILLKLPSIAADLITAYILYRLAKDRLPGFWPLAVAGMYLFNPAVFINSAVWGQVDSFLVLFFALGFLILESKVPEQSGIAFAIAVLIKPQGLILLPVVLFVLLKQKAWMKILKTALYGLFTAIILVLPFAVNQEPLWIFKLYLNTAEGYQYVSLNAFNFFSLIGDNLKPDSEKFIIFSYQFWGYIFILAMVIFTAVLHWKGKVRHIQYIDALVLSMGVFMLSVRMHERYMFPVLFFLAVIFILTRDKWSLLFFGISSFTIFVNTYAVLDRMIKHDYPHVSPDDPVLLLISLINVIMFVAVLIWSWRSAVKGKTLALDIKESSQDNGTSLWLNQKSSKNAANEHYEPLRVNRKDIVIMTVMTVIYLGIAFINLGSFDVPQTEWAGYSSSQDGFIIDLGSPQVVSRLTFYSGLGEGSYHVWYKDSEGVYMSLEDMVVDDFYKWHILEVSQTTSRFLVRVNDGGGMIKEIGVFGEDKNKPLPIEIKNLDESPAQGELLHLADEQHLARYRNDYMTSTYFDEIYHARTAYEHLNRINPYEWTHPPLGKILISIGIALFGMNTFGWRIVGTLTGVVMIPLMYLFGKKLFQKWFYGFCAAFLMMFDLMHFAQTRIATIDSYTTLFVILMYYFMADYYLQKSYNKGFYRSLIPLLLSGIFFGLGAATKWSAIYGAPGLALIFFMAKYNEYKDYKRIKAQYSDKNAMPDWVNKFIPVYFWKTILFCVLFFIIIPGTIYILSYIPYLMVPGKEFSDILEYQKSMYRYHSTLQATHDFQSDWWTWPLIIRPIWYYQGKDLPAGMASTIASFGNPAVWWAGVVAFFAAVKAALNKNKAMILVVVAVISQYLPWMMISRAAFIYHFFPMMPFMILAIVYVIKKRKDNGINNRYILAYLGIVMLLFIIFYPAVSGLVVPEWYIMFLRWLPSWYF